MKYLITRQFQKDLDKIQDKRILQKVLQTIENIQLAKSINEIAHSEALKGFQGFFKIKFDYRYRIGFVFNNNSQIIELKRCLGREGFYNQFP